MRVVGLALAGLLCGCAAIAPMTPPPQLSATPGPPVTITENTYRTTAFETWYASDWRVVSSASFVAPHAVFISPCEAAVIALAVDADDIDGVIPPAAEGELTREVVMLDGGLTALFVSATPVDATHRRIFTRMVESVRDF